VAGNPGRDDKGKGSASINLQMIGIEGEQQVPPLRYAPVGMTLLLGTDGAGGTILFTTLSNKTAKIDPLNTDPSASLGMTKGSLALPSYGRGLSGVGCLASPSGLW
jgi:hypothetical protein